MVDKFHRRCCFNCTHHLDYHMNGPHADTVVCAIRAEIPIETDMGGYIGVDYSKRMPAAHPPCGDWQVDTNVPKGCHLEFEEPKQLTINFES